MGYGSRVDSSSLFGANERIVGMEVARKKTEYQNHIELTQISKLYEAEQVCYSYHIIQFYRNNLNLWSLHHQVALMH